MRVRKAEEANQVLPGLEPFVFDPGPQPSKEELAAQAERRVRHDKRLAEEFQNRKSDISDILQGCMDSIREQLEKGEEMCRKAHFPLLHPFDFSDLEALAAHDFTVNLHEDVVDRCLKQFVDNIFRLTWSHVNVENEVKAAALERYNEALQARMETLEHHLFDRARMLSNCRFAYFLEITHLRNQVYIKYRQGEKFEATEAYFFDPTEFLEEELRMQLNDKISLSCKVYHEKLQEMQRKVEDLEMRLETYASFDISKYEDLVTCLQLACNKHGNKAAVEALADLAPKEMKQWAEAYAQAQGMVPGSVELERRRLEEEVAALQRESEHMRKVIAKTREQYIEEQKARHEAEQDLDKLLRWQKDAEARLEAAGMRGTKNDDPPPPRIAPKHRASADLLDDSATTEELRKQLARLELELNKAKQKTEDAEKRAAEATSKIGKLQGEVKALASERDAANAAAASAAAAAGAARSRPDSAASIGRASKGESGRMDGKSTADLSTRATSEDLVDSPPGSRLKALQVLKEAAEMFGEEFTAAPAPKSQLRGSKTSGGGKGGGAAGAAAPAGRAGGTAGVGSGKTATAWAAADALAEASVGPDEGQPAGAAVAESKAASRPASAGGNTTAPAKSALQGAASSALGGGAKAMSSAVLRVMANLKQPVNVKRQDTQAEMEDYAEWASTALEKAKERIDLLQRQVVKAQNDADEAEARHLEEMAAAVTQAEQEARAAERRRAAKDAEKDRAARLKEEEEEEERRRKLRLKTETTIVEEVTHRRKKVTSGDGFDDSDAQTIITGFGEGGGFYLLELPPTEDEIAIEAELEDLNQCAQGNWMTTLEHIRGAQRPPHGTGSGYVSRGAFLRLFQGARQRLARHHELSQMVDNLKRAELDRVLQGVHFLMESDVPDEDAATRDAIFGRGFTHANLNGSVGLYFDKLVKRWDRYAGKVVSSLQANRNLIELGVHMGRRNFVPGGGAGGQWKVQCQEAYVGAGGGLMARQRKDFSPPRSPTYQGILQEGADGNDILSVNQMYGGVRPGVRDWISGTYSSGEEEDDDGRLSIYGRAVFPQVSEPGVQPESEAWRTFSMESQDPAKEHIVVGGRLVPRATPEGPTPRPSRGPTPRPSQQHDEGMAIGRRSRSPPREPRLHQLAKPPRAGSPPLADPRDLHVEGHSRSPSPTRRSEQATEAGGGGSVSAGPSLGGQGQLVGGLSVGSTLGSTVVAPNVWTRCSVRVSSKDPSQVVAMDASPPPQQGGSAAAGGKSGNAFSIKVSGTRVGPRSAAKSAAAAQKRAPSAEAPEAAEGTEENTDGAFADYSPSSLDEPQAEPAPGPFTGGVAGTTAWPTPKHGLVVGDAGAPLATGDLDRDIEKIRQKLNEARLGDRGPVPSWEYEQIEAQKTRAAGGRHTSHFVRPDSRGSSRAAEQQQQRPGQRASSAGAAGRVRALSRTTSGRFKVGTPGVATAAGGAAAGAGAAAADGSGAATAPVEKVQARPSTPQRVGSSAPVRASSPAGLRTTPFPPGTANSAPGLQPRGSSLAPAPRRGAKVSRPSSAASNRSSGALQHTPGAAAAGSTLSACPSTSARGRRQPPIRVSSLPAVGGGR